MKKLLFAFLLCAAGVASANTPAIATDCQPQELGGNAAASGYGWDSDGAWAWSLCANQGSFAYVVGLWADSLSLAKLGDRTDTIRTSTDHNKALNAAFVRYVKTAGTEEKYDTVTTDMCNQMGNVTGLIDTRICH